MEWRRRKADRVDYTTMPLDRWFVCAIKCGGLEWVLDHSSNCPLGWLQATTMAYPPVHEFVVRVSSLVLFVY
jgi:hypothetical protein